MAHPGRDPQLLGQLIKDSLVHHIHGHYSLSVLFPRELGVSDRYLFQIILVLFLIEAQCNPSFHLLLFINMHRAPGFLTPHAHRTRTVIPVWLFPVLFMPDGKFTHGKHQ